MDYESRERHTVIHSPAIGSRTCCNFPSMDGLGHGIIHDYRVLSMTWSVVIDNQLTSRWMDDDPQERHAVIQSPLIGNKTCCNLPSMVGLEHGIIHGYRVLSMTWSVVIDNHFDK